MDSLKLKMEVAELTMIRNLLSGRVQDTNLLPLIELSIPTFNSRYEGCSISKFPPRKSQTKNGTELKINIFYSVHRAHFST